jgi:hypothetical protein
MNEFFNKSSKCSLYKYVNMDLLQMYLKKKKQSQMYK